MKQKIKYKQAVVVFLSRLNDIRFIGQLLFIVIVLLISWSGIKSIQTNYGLQKQITALNQQNELQQLQDENLKLQNQYFKSNQYLELSARQDLGLAAPGEKEVIVPQSVALAHTINLQTTSKQTHSQLKKPFFQQNIQSWANFFLHRPNTTN